MAETTDPGGGSTTVVCTPSPNDEVAIFHNLIKRVSDIERFLNQLVGADVYANNLSELAADIGNILNGTIILPGTGSPLGPGGSIPIPDGFSGTVISGNVITTWTDGVVSFEVIPSQGVTVGSFTKVDAFNGADTVTYTATATTKVIKNFTVDHSDGLISQNVSTGKLTFASTGYYMIGYVISIDAPAGIGSDKRFSHGFGSGSGWYSNLYSVEEITGQTGIYSFAGCYMYHNTGTPDGIYLQVSDTGTAGSTRTVDCPSLYIIKLKA